MKNLKDLMKALKIAEENANKADAAWECDPENEELEAAFDKAYAKEHEAFENLVDEIVKVTAGKIDRNTARTMIIKKRGQLEALIARAA